MTNRMFFFSYNLCMFIRLLVFLYLPKKPYSKRLLQMYETDKEIKLYIYHLWFCSRLGDAQIGSTSTSTKAVTNSRNYRIKEQQQQTTSGWEPQYTDVIELQKSGTVQNNNNDNTYATSDATNCNGCGNSKCGKDDINRSRSISIQRSGNIAATSVLNHSHCFDDQPVAKSQRSHLHRSRSKTVATNLSDNRFDLTAIPADRLRICKRKTNQIRMCSQTQLDPMERKSAYSDADLLNGNVLDTTVCNDSTTVTSLALAPRIICRNRSRTSSKCTQSTCSKLINSTVANPSIKRGKRTLSSTQIEREKSDEKTVKLKKHAVLRSLSPILVASSARNSIKKMVATNAKWF